MGTGDTFVSTEYGICLFLTNFQVGSVIKRIQNARQRVTIKMIETIHESKINISVFKEGRPVFNSKRQHQIMGPIYPNIKNMPDFMCPFCSVVSQKSHKTG